MNAGRPRINPTRPGETRQAASLRAARARWRAEGLCPDCGSACAPDRARCQRCLDLLAAAARRRRERQAASAKR